jgi:DNA-binding MarR family transcriptional regulator
MLTNLAGMAGSARGTGRDGRPAAGLATRLHAVAIHLLRRVRRTDTLMGVSPARASVLSVLVFGGPRTIGELAELEQVRAPTMTRLVTGLESDGYAVRKADARDGRVVVVHATSKGRRVLERGRDLRVRQIESVLSALTPAESNALSRAVAALERELSTPALPP